jgi:hypothetical protein
MTTETTVQQPTPSKCKGRLSMLIPTLLMAALAAAFTIVAYGKGDGSHIAGAKQAFGMTVEILPRELPMQVGVLGRLFTAVRHSVHVSLPASRGDDRRPHGQVDQLRGSVRRVRTRGVTR